MTVVSVTSWLFDAGKANRQGQILVSFSLLLKVYTAILCCMNLL